MLPWSDKASSLCAAVLLSSWRCLSSQMALIHCELNVKDEANAGDHISMDMKAESLRLVFNRAMDIYGNSLSRFFKMLAIMAAWTTKLINRRSLPTQRSRLAFWLVAFVENTLARVIDDTARQPRRERTLL
jgi:hypothetical protein